VAALRAAAGSNLNGVMADAAMPRPPCVEGHDERWPVSAVCDNSSPQLGQCQVRVSRPGSPGTMREIAMLLWQRGHFGAVMPLSC
jgi:hypothetical protein